MASQQKVAPYGTWDSPISLDLLAGGSNSLAEVHVHPSDGSIYVVERRPGDGGRSTLVQITGGKSTDVLPANYDIRSAVHEYGGGAANMGNDGTLVFSDVTSGGIFRFKSSTDIQPLVKAHREFRYADFNTHPKNSNLVLAVKEDHTKRLPAFVVNTVVIVNGETQTTETLLEGADFYSHPKFSPDGKWVSWIQWDHPDMPWIGSELYVAEYSDGKLGKHRLIAGKAGTEAVGQPKWLSSGYLVFGSDRTGYNQIYIFDLKSFNVRQVQVKGFEDADLTAQFRLGECSYAELSHNTIVLAYTRKAVDGLLLVNILSKQVIKLPLSINTIVPGIIRRVSDSKFVVIGSDLTSLTALYLIDVSNPKVTVLRSSSTFALKSSVVSRTQHVTFPRTAGKDPQGNAYAIWTPPYNSSFTGPKDSKPPLIVGIHGGPTGHTSMGLNLQTQYYTSRGYAYVWVNYAGSTGYGRKYWESLNYNWGIKDIDDSASCVAYLVSKGLVDGTKVGIVGGSAGGYTVLQSLVTYPKLYAAGNSLFGVANFFSFAQGTHKFESHYLDALLYLPNATEEEKRTINWLRSPQFHASRIERPLLLLQGEIDRVVPMEQAVEMEKVVRKQGGDVKLVIMPGEGHGFRKEENVRRAVVEEEALWRRTLL